MNEADKKQFGVVIGALHEAFGQEATKGALLGYWMGLSDMAIEEVSAAVTEAVRASERMPRPAELRRYAGEKSADARAIAAWGDVQRAIPLGPYRHIEFEDRLVNASIRLLGGWPSFVDRLSGAEDEKWARIDFVKTYTALAGSGVDGEATLPLAGLSEVEVIGGHQVSPQVRRIPCEESRKRIPCKINVETRRIETATNGTELMFQKP